MKTIAAEVRFGSRQARDRGDIPHILTPAETLEPVKVMLTKPVESDGKEIDHIVIHPPGVDDMLDGQFEDQNKENIYKRLAKACNGIPPETFRIIPTRDFNKLYDILGAFSI